MKKLFFIGLCLLSLCGITLAQTLGPPSSGSSGGGSAPCSAFGTAAGTCAQGNDSRFPSATITNTLSSTTPCAIWTPTDQSGAGLSFTSVSANYCQIGNMVFAYGTFTYPVTVSASNAIISLPVAVPNQSYAVVYGTNLGVGTNALPETVKNSSTMVVVTAAGVAVPNSTLSTKVINVLMIYPSN